MKIKSVIPDYLTEFRCIGSACSDSCCSGFSVPVDKNTYQKYQNVENKKIVNKIKKYVQLNEKNSSELNYAKINATCGCPFITGENLCQIQAELGEEMLSSTCSKYPKYINVVDGKAETSATLSCPEVARLVLGDSKGIRMTEQDVEVDERNFARTNFNSNMLPMTTYFQDLRRYSVEIIQNRNYSFHRRLNTLKVFFYNMAQLVEQGKESDIPQLLQLVNLESISEEFHHSIEIETVIAEVEYFKTIHPLVNSYESTFAQLLMGKEQLSNAGSAFLSENEYILENYFTNYIFQHVFPFSYGNTVFDAYLMLQLHYELITLHINAVASHLGYMDIDTSIKVIQSWVKEAEHNSIYLPFLFRRMQ